MPIKKHKKIDAKKTPKHDYSGIIVYVTYMVNFQFI